MKLGWRWTALVLAVGLGAGPAAHAAQSPMDVVRALYSQPSDALGGPGASGYLAQDLSAALQSAAVRAHGSSPVAFDYRYGARETEISGFALLPQVDNDEASVVAVFKNFGEPESVDWTLCRTPDGDWRVADASSNTGRQSWDLRKILMLSRTTVQC